MSGELIKIEERAMKMAWTAAKGCGTCQAQEGYNGTGVTAEDSRCGKCNLIKFKSE